MCPNHADRVSQTVLMQMPTGAIGIIILLISIWLTNKFKVRFVIIAALCIPPIAGATALTQVSRSNTRGLLASYYVAQMLAALREFPVQTHLPPLTLWQSHCSTRGPT